ncbi:thioredoxin [Magnetococcus marinus MC-1]|uniref:Thioredoxin n=1 Tax=Magnetococcus marinus (strain ATCC BAA-1437 / JCM 17883 / MC-1) TaxID=156889 RepID=A0L8S0_MAGMM|nr:thioredoxin [Magnetococcus marinus]ABK44363.1 thioredoxin [Magnetococcus marinus MC-1]
MATIDLTKDNFQETVTGDNIVIVDFWASWCGPCKAFAPIFEKVSESNPDVVFAKVNTDEQRELAMEFQIRSIPTLMIFRDNVIIFSQPGMLPEQALVELIGKAKELDMDEVRKEIANASQAEEH